MICGFCRNVLKVANIYSSCWVAHECMCSQVNKGSSVCKVLRLGRNHKQISTMCVSPGWSGCPWYCKERGKSGRAGAAFVCGKTQKGHSVAPPSLCFEKCGNMKATAAFNDCVRGRQGRLMETSSFHYNSICSTEQYRWQLRTCWSET